MNCCLITRKEEAVALVDNNGINMKLGACNTLTVKVFWDIMLCGLSDFSHVSEKFITSILNVCAVQRE
jgi:hypothetical protein